MRYKRTVISFPPQRAVLMDENNASVWSRRCHLTVSEQNTRLMLAAIDGNPPCKAENAPTGESPGQHRFPSEYPAELRRRKKKPPSSRPAPF